VIGILLARGRSVRVREYLRPGWASQAG